MTDSENRLELDIYLPKERLALEYHGQQHYYDVYALGHRWHQKQRDEEKRLACKSLGITLLEIPYWWDFQKASLVATIHQQRSDLVLPEGDAKPIPSEPIVAPTCIFFALDI
jgi:hypothetical protein